MSVSHSPKANRFCLTFWLPNHGPSFVVALWAARMWFSSQSEHRTVLSYSMVRVSVWVDVSVLQILSCWGALFGGCQPLFYGEVALFIASCWLLSNTPARSSSKSGLRECHNRAPQKMGGEGGCRHLSFWFSLKVRRKGYIPENTHAR